jgi:hypothetical protein
MALINPPTSGQIAINGTPVLDGPKRSSICAPSAASTSASCFKRRI